MSTSIKQYPYLKLIKSMKKKNELLLPFYQRILNFQQKCTYFDPEIGGTPKMAQTHQMAQYWEIFMLKIVFSTQFCMEKATTTDDLRKVMACL